jgi:MFS family permease
VKSRIPVLSQSAGFLKRQHPDWKVTVGRTALQRFVYQSLLPYLSIYIIALGATATQLGLVNSAGMIVAGIVGPLTGWFIDKTGPKKIYLIGISMLAISYLTYALAHSWQITLLAMAAYWLGHSISMHGCATVCGNCLTNEDRATGMTICETVAAGLLGMVGPMLGAWIVTASGGVNVEGIRPLFYFSLAIVIGSFFLVLTQLSGNRWVKRREQAASNLFHDIFQVLKGGQYKKRWLMITSITSLPLAMVFPFSQVFAHEVKGADQFALAAMVTGAALASIIFAIPLGRLADTIGRKKILFITMPLFWISNLLLIWSPNTVVLIIAGTLQGFHYIGGPIAAAAERELVSPEQMGRWLGIVRLFRMLINAILAFVSGLIWDKLGPQYVFLAFLAIDVLIRCPLIASMPETLNMKLSADYTAEKV